MSESLEARKKITFYPLGGDPISARVKPGSEATLGAVAAQVAGRLGFAGTFECLDRQEQDQVISPETRLADLPDGTEITLADNPTPAGCTLSPSCPQGKGWG